MTCKIWFALLIAAHLLCSSTAATISKSPPLVKPISIRPSQNWDGIDGRWSSFSLQVGNPPQLVRSLISFTSYQTWVVLPEGCQIAKDFDGCASSRGGLFFANRSSTFNRFGTYDLSTADELDLRSNAIFGYDRLTLGAVGDGGPSLSNTTVGCMALETFYEGVFGLNPKPSNFSNFNNGSPSYMSQLKESELIPSLAAGYTAGAHYLSAGATASLTLGGYDRSRFMDNDVEFSLAADNDRELVVAVRSIIATSRYSTSPSSASLLPEPIYVLVDSTVSQLWLPLKACQYFEIEFGLIYDNATSLYLVNNTHHQALLDRNPSITFTIAQGPSDGPAVNITLPYAAFDLIVNPPYRDIGSSSYYFPLRRAANNTQYTLGRTFLQEAYLSVNWETRRFNISQAKWSAASAVDIVALPAANTGGSFSAGMNNHTMAGLSKSAVAGIVIGSASAGALLLVVLLFCSKKHRKPAERRKQNALDDLRGSVLSKGTGAVITMTELSTLSNHPERSNLARLNQDSSGQDSLCTFPSNSSTIVCEADSKECTIYEMLGEGPVILEKDSRALSEKEAHARREEIYNGVDASESDTRSPNDAEHIASRATRSLLKPMNVRLVRARQKPCQSSGGLGSSTNSSTSALVSPVTLTGQLSSDTSIELTERSSGRPATRHRAFSFELPTSPLPTSPLPG